jgi:putative heme-binding domain-containing protein
LRLIRWTAPLVVLGLVSSSAGSTILHAQDRATRATEPARPTVNPFNGNADAVRNGQGIYRQRCALCHGMDARGHRGPDLTVLWAAGRTDAGVFQTILKGVAGTEMPPAGIRTPDDELWKVMAYLRTLAVPAPSGTPKGDAANGERLFRVHCSNCHRVSGRGGRLGPDLSRIGTTRTRAALVRQIRGANEDIRPGYEPVTLQTPNGQTIRGVRKNEDVSSIQIMDSRERIQGYLKEDLRDVTNEKRSLMPAYSTDQLSESDLDDLVRYLESLRGAVKM